MLSFRWRLRRSRSRNRPTGTWPVLDHDLLSPLLAQAFGDDPKVGVYGAARRTRNLGLSAVGQLGKQAR